LDALLASVNLVVDGLIKAIVRD